MKDDKNRHLLPAHEVLAVVEVEGVVLVAVGGAGMSTKIRTFKVFFVF
jgi:hypothetical protein